MLVVRSAERRARIGADDAKRWTQTFAALAEANRAQRAPAPLSALTVGLQCGGSDGFSGISANPTVGYVSDLLVRARAARRMLSEFPELHGVEQELINRCATR